MDATNLATMFAPNLLHTFPDETSGNPAVSAAASSITKGSGFLGSPTSSFTASSSSPERMEYVAAIRFLIERRDAIFELPEGELNDLYTHLWENCTDVLDVMLRRRLALAGQE
jgi:hypothetical protein